MFQKIIYITKEIRENRPGGQENRSNEGNPFSFYDNFYASSGLFFVVLKWKSLISAFWNELDLAGDGLVFVSVRVFCLVLE